MGFSVDGRQCWPPTWPIGFSHLDTSRCRTDPALPTATSSIDLEHILHIPATILQASVGSILSPWTDPSWIPEGTHQGQNKQKHRGKDSEKERCDFENRRKGENPFWALRWHNCQHDKKIRGCCQGLNTSHTQDIGQRKVLKTAFKSSHSRALMPSWSPEVIFLTWPGLLKISDKWYQLKTKFNVWSL